MSQEASKAYRRRICEEATGGIKWSHFLQGRGIDVGCGPDPLPYPDTLPFDMDDGDANHLSRFFQEGEFDWLHSSQSLEHMVDPMAALLDWIKVVKSGGHLIVTVPSWELYEGMVWPSRWNPDHKSTWSMVMKGSPAPHHIHVPSFLPRLNSVADVLISRQLDCNYDYKAGTSFDQTWVESAGVEPWIEFVLCKR